MTDVNSDYQSLSRAEIGWVVAITLIACILRCANAGGTSLSHFDEGVYILWALVGGYPAKEFYAPPLLPLMIRGLATVLGDSELWGQILVGVFGAATIPAIWWLTRRWYGPAAAVASASMAALSGFHIAFSRLVLTDVPFTFWFIVSLVLIWESLNRIAAGPGDVRSAASRAWFATVSAGLTAGATLNTKYNGVLVLGLSGIGGLFLLWSRYGRGVRWIPAVVRFAAIVLIAALAYAPWFWHIESTFGYGSLVRHHRGYSTGMTEWGENLYTLVLSERFLDQRIGWIGAGVGCIAAMAVSGSTLSIPTLTVLAASVIGGYALGDGLGWIIGSIGLLCLARRDNPGTAFHVVWLGGLLLLTPLYRPYARLALPLIASGWVAFGAITGRLLQRVAVGETVERIRVKWPAAWLACVIGAGIVWWDQELRQHGGPLDGFGPASLRSACEQAVGSVPESERLDTYVRPPALFYLLERGGNRVFGPRDPSDPGDFSRWLNEPGAPRYLVVDQALLRDNPMPGEKLDESASRVHLVARFAYRPSDPVLLDDFGRTVDSPEFQSLIDQTYQILLYRKLDSN